MKSTERSDPRTRLRGPWDAVVIGAGFGGLGAALRLAEHGARVLVLETLKYPGGCASTFTRNGYRFEAGATLFSGFGEGQLMREWIDRHGLDVAIDYPDPMIELRTPTFRIPLSRDRLALVEHLANGDPETARRLVRFFDDQKTIADVLWELFDDPDLLPPLRPGNLLRHVRRSPRYLRLLPLIGRPLSTLVDRHELTENERLRVYLNALCQITVQAPADEAEAPFALAAIDYLFRGTGHIRGGVGQLASELVRAIENRGGTVAFTTRARALRREGGGWRIDTNRGEVRAPVVCANLLPQAIQRLSRDEPAIDAGMERTVRELTSQVETGWGAAMLYLAIRSDARPGHAHHLELVRDPARRFEEGNHLFCSISDIAETDRAPAGNRTVTVSTHLPMSSVGAEDVERAQIQMRATLRELAPEVDDAITFSMTASPRTFERFTGRPRGFVGGIPRRAGLSNYRQIGPLELGRGLYLVGDTAFPGQSTLATALGGVRTADAIAGR